MARSSEEEVTPATVADTLARAVPYLSQDLVRASALARVEAVAALLPASLTNWIFLESRLTGRSGQVDLIVKVREEGRGILAGRARQLAISDGLRNVRVWPAIESFARLWQEPSGGLLEAVEGLWLEFDLRCGTSEGEVPSPRVFVDFPPLVSRAPSVEARLRPLLAALEGLGIEISQQRRAALRRCLECLPSDSGLVYVGAAPEDPEGPLRLCILGLRDADLAVLLEAMAWPGDIAALSATVLEPLARTKSGGERSFAIAHLDLAETLQPTIGLEYPFTREPQARGEIEETAFLDLLVARGLCDERRRRALVAWPGKAVEWMPHQVWRCRCVRRLNHVKLVLDPTRPPEAKAYLCFFQELLPGGAWPPGLLGGHPGSTK